MLRVVYLVFTEGCLLPAARRHRRLPLGAPSAAATDWQQIALLYGELLKYEPIPVTEANRAVAVAMAAGPEADAEALDAYQAALQPRSPAAERSLIGRRISELSAG